MSNKNGQSTGPKTVEGKAVSSKNAQTHAIFTKEYLPWEDGAAHQQDFEQMCTRYRAHDPVRRGLLRSIAQDQLMEERLARAQRLKIEGALQSSSIKRRFGQEVGLLPHQAEQLPMWYFALQDDGSKAHALFLADVQSQAALLKKQYSDAIVPQIEEYFPALYKFVMTGQQVKTSFLTVLGQRFKQSMPTLNLSAVINHISEQYPYHVDWAAQAQRYQGIIDGLQAQIALEAMDLDKFSRYTTMLQNRRLKNLQALAAQDLHDHQMQSFAKETAQHALLDNDLATLIECDSVSQVASVSPATATATANVNANATAKTHHGAQQGCAH